MIRSFQLAALDKARKTPVYIRRSWLLVAAVVLAFVVLLIRTAWMSDDAYITLRTVDNFIHGYGLRWNAAERVQSYTHPLWMLLLSLVYFFTHEAYYTSLVVSILVSVLAVVLLLSKVATRSPWSMLGAAALLLLSKAFIDFSTSGLENPLTHLLLVLFYIVYLRRLDAPRKLLLLSLIAGLLAVNRIDAVLLVSVPFLVFLAEERAYVRRHFLEAVGRIGLSFAPFLAWELFSLVYYGFLVPNTAFAKLNTGIPRIDLLRQGFVYLVQSTRIDSFTSVALLAAAGLVLAARRARLTAIVIAAGLYLAYVVWFGGDFMSGRFLAAPLFCVVAALAASGMLERLRVGPVVLAASLVLGVVQPYSPLWGDRLYRCGTSESSTGVNDERACYYPYTGLLLQHPSQPVTPNHGWLADGLRARENPFKVRLAWAVGLIGYGAGPDVYVVDELALGDPLLARLPMTPGKKWRIGHFDRLIPAGYLETLASGQNKLCDHRVAEYYDHLSTILRGPLWSPERWREIWKMNTGQYDALVEAYNAPRALAADLCNAQGMANVRFVGAPTLVGYAAEAQGSGMERKLAVTLYWQRGDEHPNALATFVHVLPSQPGQAGNPNNEYGIWAQGEHFQPGGYWSMEYWGGQVYTDMFLLPLPPDMPAGDYVVDVGWFDPRLHHQFEPDQTTVREPLRVFWQSVLLPPVPVP